MKTLIIIFLWTLLAGVASAQLPPVQTINTNQGIGCNAITSQGAVTKCVPGWTYGCSATGSTNNILGTDGNRTAILFQNIGTQPLTLTFGDSAVYGVNGFTVSPGTPFLWSNLGQGNLPGRVPTGPISVIVPAGSQIPCMFMFSD